MNTANLVFLIPTYGIVLLFGYIVARYAHFSLRFVPIPFALWAGVWFCSGSRAGFREFFLFPLASYVLGDIIGLWHRAHATKKPYMEYYPLDWMILIVIGALLAGIYYDFP